MAKFAKKLRLDAKFFVPNKINRYYSYLPSFGLIANRLADYTKRWVAKY
jgi:hypothetical protein